MISVIAVVVTAGVFFALGRIKNTAKLAAVKAEVEKIEAYAISDVKTALARIKAKF